LLVALSQGDNSPGVEEVDLGTGTSAIRVAPGANTREAVWTNDGSSFICVNETDDTIYLVSSTGLHRLATGVNPGVSPDGTKMAYVGGSSNQIMLLAADGTAPVQLTNGPDQTLGPSFSPDGREIAFSKKTNGLWQVWVMDANGANQHQITQGADHARFAVWSPDGKELAYNTTLPDELTPKDVWLVEANGQNPRQLVTGGQNGRPDWAGDSIFFNSDRDRAAGYLDVWAIHPDGSGLTRITRSAADTGRYAPEWHAG